MKRPPEMQRLEEILRSSKIVAGGFLGDDHRPLEEVIESDKAELAATGYSARDISERMRHIESVAAPGLGSWVKIDDKVEASVTDTRGRIPCPWPHPGSFSKAVVTARNTKNGKVIQWSDLSCHMIEKHGFFEGRGAAFRLEPKEVVDTILAP
jgi:hypothetical protein